jgi:hypothetical protein
MNQSVTKKIAKVEGELGKKITKMTTDLEALARALAKGIKDIKKAIGVEVGEGK